MVTLCFVQRKDAVADQSGPESGVGEAEAAARRCPDGVREGEQVRAGHALRHIGVDEITVELLSRTP